MAEKAPWETDAPEAAPWETEGPVASPAASSGQSNPNSQFVLRLLGEFMKGGAIGGAAQEFAPAAPSIGQGVAKGAAGTANYLADTGVRLTNSAGLTRIPQEQLPSARFNRFAEQLFGGTNPTAEAVGQGVGMAADPFGYMFKGPEAAQGVTRNLTEKELTQVGGQNLGLKTTPALASGSTIGQRFLGTLGSRTALDEEARIANDQVWQRIARSANNLDDGAHLNFATMDKRVADLVKEGYDPVRAAGWFPTKTLKNDLMQVVKMNMTGRMDDERKAFITALEPYFQKSLTGDEAITAIQRLRERASTEFGKQNGWLGKAFNEAAATIEQTLEGGLTTKGAQGQQLLQGYQQARKNIAIAKATKDAIVEGSGSVDPLVFAKKLQNEVPLTGDLATGARYANTFETISQLPREGKIDVGQRMSALNLNKFWVALQALGKPLRSHLLSDATQDAMRPNVAPLQPMNEDFMRLLINSPGGIYGATLGGD